MAKCGCIAHIDIPDLSSQPEKSCRRQTEARETGQSRPGILRRHITHRIIICLQVSYIVTNKTRILRTYGRIILHRRRDVLFLEHPLPFLHHVPHQLFDIGFHQSDTLLVQTRTRHHFGQGD